MNVLGDSFGAGIVQHLSRNDLGELEGVESDHEIDVTKANGKPADIDDVDIKLERKVASDGVNNPGFNDTRM